MRVILMNAMLLAAILAVVGCGRPLDVKPCPEGYHSEQRDGRYVCVANDVNTVPQVMEQQ